MEQQIKWWYLITSELFGSFTLGLLGGAISANICLKNTKCSSSNLFTGAFGWGIAIMTGVFFAIALNGIGELNPIITIAIAIADNTNNWGFKNYTSDIPYAGMFFIVLLIQFVAYILAQILVDIIYWRQIKESLSSSDPNDAFSVLSIHASLPTHNSKINILPLLAEFVASAVFVFATLFLLINFDQINFSTSKLIRIFILTIIIIVILMSLGGITGPSVNPTRELAAILTYLLIPFKNKQKIDWKYLYVPICGPILGSIFASLIFRFAIFK